MATAVRGVPGIRGRRDAMTRIRMRCGEWWERVWPAASGRRKGAPPGLTETVEHARADAGIAAGQEACAKKRASTSSVADPVPALIPHGPFKNRRAGRSRASGCVTTECRRACDRVRISIGTGTARSDGSATGPCSAKEPPPDSAKTDEVCFITNEHGGLARDSNAVATKSRRRPEPRAALMNC